MRIVQRINHNAALCIDGDGREVIALGKGVGYPQGTDELAPAQIFRTFYGVDARYLPLLNEIDPAVFEFSSQLADAARGLVSYELGANLAFTLADHIAFIIQRVQDNMAIRMPFAHDIRYSYPMEYKLGKLAIERMRELFGIPVPESEAAGIAMSIISSQVVPSSKAKSVSARRNDRVLDQCTRIVEQEMRVRIDRESFNFARFATHLQYLFERVSGDAAPLEGNEALVESMREEYPRVFACAEDVGRAITTSYGGELAEDELLYLSLHINRLCEKVEAPGGGR